VSLLTTFSTVSDCGMAGLLSNIYLSLKSNPKLSKCQFYQCFTRTFFVQASFWATFSSYVSALAPTFCAKNVRVNVDEIDSKSLILTAELTWMYDSKLNLKLLQSISSTFYETAFTYACRSQTSKLDCLFYSFGIHKCKSCT
jgi:hypothetical protein